MQTNTLKPTWAAAVYRRLPVYVLFMLSVHGCRSAPTNDESIKLYVFDCGRLRYESIEFFGIRDHETEVRELVAPCFVIEHEEGRLLWEGGLPSTLAESRGWQEMDGGWSMRLDSKLDRTLAS